MPFRLLSGPLAPFLALVPLLTGQTATPQSTAADTVGFDRDARGRMTVPVRVQEQGPFEFLVDTGSQNTVLSETLAQRLALEPGRKAWLVGIAGTSQVDTVTIDQLDLGRRSYYGLLAPLLQSSDIGADGILGVDSLQGQRVIIDFERRAMTIDDARKAGGSRGYEIVITARRRSGQLIMTHARIDGVWTDVIIDTGAENSIGNRALQDALKKRRAGAERVVLDSVTGQQIVADVDYGSTLSIGDLHINNMMIAFADAPPFAALNQQHRPTILLGMRELRVFKRVGIDFSARKILFDIPAEAR